MRTFVGKVCPKDRIEARMELTTTPPSLTCIVWIFISLSSLKAGAIIAQPVFHHWSSSPDITPGNQQLLSPSNKTTLLRHRCYRNTLLYIRGRIYLTQDGFATAVSPLSAPSHLLQGVEEPSLRSAAFAGRHLVLAVGGVVLVHDLRTGLASRAQGIPGPDLIMTTADTNVIAFPCCYNDTEWCRMQDETVAVFESGTPHAGSLTYHLSLDAGRTFHTRRLHLDFDIEDEVLGGTVLGSPWAIAFLVLRRDTGQAQFLYDPLQAAVSTSPRHQPTSLPFSVSGNQTSFVQSTNGRGSLVIWDSKNVYYSAVSGKAVIKALYQSADLASSLPDQAFVKQVITSDQQDFAVLTSENDLYFGREGLPPKLVKLPLKTALACPENSCAVTFTAAGDVEVLHPASVDGSNVSHQQQQQQTAAAVSGLMMLSEIFPVQQRLAEVFPALPMCQHQGFVADFHNGVFYLDLGQEMSLTAKAIPNAWEQVTYMVTLSNPDILTVITSVEELGLQAPGVAITNVMAKVKLVADTLPNGHKDEARGMSTLGVSVHNPSLMCQHKHQAVAYIVAGCPPSRNLRVRRTELNCPDMRDYVYNIDKNAYDPTFRLGSSGVTASVDKEVSFDYGKLGCPIVSYHQDGFKPVIDLYDGDVFVEEMRKEYVVNEIHGIFTYSYSQTAQQAGCKSQPQRWLSLLAAQEEPDPGTAWTRKNYRSCLLEESAGGLTRPGQPYEVLSSRTDNRLTWRQYNGILVFNVSVMDPDYSLCQLRTQFAVRVYGVLPRSTLAPLRIMLATCGIGLAVLVAGYVAKRLWAADAARDKDKIKAEETAEATS